MIKTEQYDRKMQALVSTHDFISELKNKENNSFLENLDYSSLVKNSKFQGEILQFLDMTLGTFIFLDLEKKLSELQIKYISKNLATILRIEADYCIETNRIRILKNKISRIYHELFHAMTSFRLNETTNGCGFYQKINSLYIGSLLDEGYTDLLTYRYFEDEINYNSEANLALKLELILGQEQMTRMYSTNDLLTLILFLAKYSSIENAITFLENFDRLDECRLSGKRTCEIVNIESNYLIDVYLNMLSHKYINGEIDRVEIKRQLESFKENFNKFLFEDSSQDRIYTSSADYIDIISKLQTNNFQKVLFNTLSN